MATKCKCPPTKRPAAKRTVPRGTRPRAGRAPPAGTSPYQSLLPVTLGASGQFPRVAGDLSYDPERGYSYGIYVHGPYGGSARVVKIFVEYPPYPDGDEPPFTYAAFRGVAAGPGLTVGQVVRAAERASVDTDPHAVAYAFESSGLAIRDLDELASGDLDKVVRWALRP